MKQQIPNLKSPTDFLYKYCYVAEIFRKSKALCEFIVKQLFPNPA